MARHRVGNQVRKGLRISKGRFQVVKSILGHWVEDFKERVAAILITSVVGKKIT
jgi:hypothetical protein